MSTRKIECVLRRMISFEGKPEIIVEGVYDWPEDKAAYVLAAFPGQFKKTGGPVDSSLAEPPRGDGSDAEPAPEKRRKKPARVRRKE